MRVANKNQVAKVDLTQPLLRQDRAAEVLGLSVRTLEKYRLSGNGPRYVKIGTRAVRYTLADLEAFATAGARQSTSEAA